MTATSGTTTSDIPETNIYVDQSYYNNNLDYHVADSPWKAEQIVRMISRHNLQLQSVYEIGCGAGEVLKQVQHNLPTDVLFAGYDISPEAIELARARANDNLNFYCGDMLVMDVPPCDLLLCIDVFEHVEDCFGFLRKMKPLGRQKLFHIPLDLSVQTIARGTPLMNWRAQYGHVQYFTKDTALATLTDTGYRIVDWFYTPSGVDQGTSMKARLAKIPRTLLSKLNQDLSVRLFGGYSLLVLAE